MNLIEKAFVGFTFIASLVLVLLYLLPFSYYVDVKKVTYHDMCVGDTRQTVTAQREVRNTHGEPALVFGQMFLIEDQKLTKLTIKRETEFIYNRTDEDVVYVIQWDEPVLEAGLYAASDYVQIEPTFFKKYSYQSEEEQTFKVYACE